MGAGLLAQMGEMHGKSDRRIVLVLELVLRPRFFGAAISSVGDLIEDEFE
jgi:hypothetical protein